MILVNPQPYKFAITYSKKELIYKYTILKQNYRTYAHLYSVYRVDEMAIDLERVIP